MARGHYSVSETNPNDRAGGSGCMCSPTHLPDAKGPFIVFHAVETDNAFSPYAVLCADCAYDAACKAGQVGGPPPAPLNEASEQYLEGHKSQEFADAVIQNQREQIEDLRAEVESLSKMAAKPKKS